MSIFYKSIYLYKKDINYAQLLEQCSALVAYKCTQSKKRRRIIEKEKAPLE
jgi:hypothetical protein